MATLTVSVTHRLAPSYTKTTGGVTGTSIPYAPSLSTSLSLASGTGSGQVDLLYAGTRTLAASATEDLDLAGGLTDVFGTVLTFVKVKYIYVKAASANTNNVIMGGAASNQFVGPFGAAAHTIAITPGSVPLELSFGTTGWTVTAGTGDLLKFANSAAGTSVTYDLIIAGTSV